MGLKKIPRQPPGFTEGASRGNRVIPFLPGKPQPFKDQPRIERIFTNGERLRRRIWFAGLICVYSEIRGSDVQRLDIRAERAHSLSQRIRISEIEIPASLIFLKKTLAPPDRRVTLVSFWGEQKPVATLVATGFNFFIAASFLEIFAG